MSTLKTYSESRKFSPEDLIPVHTLEKFGLKKMQKEFSSLIRRTRGGVVDGWTVTFSTTTDDDEDFARSEMIESLDEIQAQCQKAFR